MAIVLYAPSLALNAGKKLILNNELSFIFLYLICKFCTTICQASDIEHGKACCFA